MTSPVQESGIELAISAGWKLTDWDQDDAIMCRQRRWIRIKPDGRPVRIPEYKPEPESKQNILFPAMVPELQRRIMRTARQNRWNLIGFVGENAILEGEAVLRRGEDFIRIMPSGSAKHIKKFDWRSDQDRSVIYSDCLTI